MKKLRLFLILRDKLRLAFTLMLNNDERALCFVDCRHYFVSRNCLAEISLSARRREAKKWCAKQNVISLSLCSSNFGSDQSAARALPANKKLLYGRPSVVNHFAIKSQKSKEMHEICACIGGPIRFFSRARRPAR